MQIRDEGEEGREEGEGRRSKKAFKTRDRKAEEEEEEEEGRRGVGGRRRRRKCHKDDIESCETYS
jgi:hypothetical protein